MKTRKGSIGNLTLRHMAINSIIAAIYIVLTVLLRPISYGPVQFRLSEVFNHLVVYHSGYFYGVVVGVLIANLFSDFFPFDLTFGVLHTAVSLLITIVIRRKVKNEWTLMILNAFVFSANMFLIAIEIALLSKEAFWPVFWISWGQLFLSELTVMLIGMPLMYLLNRRLHFQAILEGNRAS